MGDEMLQTWSIFEFDKLRKEASGSGKVGISCPTEYLLNFEEALSIYCEPNILVNLRVLY